jgi:hypothetical protein
MFEIDWIGPSEGVLQAYTLITSGTLWGSQVPEQPTIQKLYSQEVGGGFQ